jgi:hypothetical protein
MSLNIVFSLVGPHAGQSLEEIFERKIKDCKILNETFWVYHSHRCTKSLFNAHKPFEVFFISASKPGAAKQTKSSTLAQQFFKDDEWFEFDKDLSPVTGRIHSKSTAFQLTNLRMVQEIIDFNDYIDIITNKPLRFSQFCSTTIASMSENKSEESRSRIICAKATLKDIVTIR